jgi:phosphohistidine phosphatase
MKKLTFIRHAKSDWSMGNQKDFDRKLNDRGLRDAPRMGFRLNEMGFNPQMIFCSPAQRTTETVELLLEQLKAYPIEKVEFVEQIYEASVRSLFEFVNAISNDFDDVAVIGHNPALTYLAEFLTNEVLENIPTAGVVQMIFPFDDWKMLSKGTGNLEFFIYPKQQG